MIPILVVEKPDEWPLNIPGAEVIPARRYLRDEEFFTRRGLRVFNLCRSYRYQSMGYYVSLLAAARGHKPLPSVLTIQDLRTPSLIRFISEELEELIQRSLASLQSEEFTLSVYFGKNMAKRYQRLALQLFNLFPAPLLRAQFARTEQTWEIQSLRPIGARHIAADHWEFMIQAATEHFAGRRPAQRDRPPVGYDLAILHDPREGDPPSSDRAVQKFVKAAQGLGMSAEVIGRDDYGRLAEFDGLFLRATTKVTNHTYRFARRAAKEGLVVIDDPDSILRCTNKVFLAELLTRGKIQTPRTKIVHRDNLETVYGELGFPCILKIPDSYFSQGVVRVDDAATFIKQARVYLEESDLVIAQEFVPTEFDWRVGILNREVLYVSRYYMAKGHWQIIHRNDKGESRYGRVETIPTGQAPHGAVQIALKAAHLVGSGLYGVDVKERDGRFYVIEVNDNPTIDVGYEDTVLGDDLYVRIMRVFLERIERIKEGRVLP